jgi:uncharacterized protein with GYD domain
LEVTVPKYLFEVSYTSEGAKGLLKGGGTARRQIVQEMTAGVKGRVEAFYFSFGENDAVVIADLPDNAAASAIAMRVAASGAARTKTTMLVTPEEVDDAASRHLVYRPPGQ